MTASTLGSRLRTALLAAKLTPAEVAREAQTTEATISNWLNDNVQLDHVKAMMLFRIADAARIDARQLLIDDGRRMSNKMASPLDESQPVKRDELKLALQLVGEALKDRSLPPEKHAEAVTLAYELLEEGLPNAKVLRFVLTAVA